MVHKIHDPCYLQGYTAALLDVLDVIEYIQEDLKAHRRKQSAATYMALIKCMLEHRAALRENPAAFMRCNDHVAGGFELWENGKRTEETDDNG